MDARPNTTSTNPAIFSSKNWSRRRLPPTNAAPTPSATKSAMKPRTKGMLETTTRRAIPGSPSRSADTADTADR